VIKNFSDLKVWQEAHRISLIIYKETGTFPKEELFGLTSQIRRASISVSSNIAEGFGRFGYKGKAQFYGFSLGSLEEMRSQLLLARDLSYLSEEIFQEINTKVESTRILLLSILKSIRKRMKEKL
jgi:four helix bundle protein